MTRLEEFHSLLTEYKCAELLFSTTLFNIDKGNVQASTLQMCHEKLTESSYALVHFVNKHYDELDGKIEFTDQELINLLNENKI